MSHRFTESVVEEAALEWFGEARLSRLARTRNRAR